MAKFARLVPAESNRSVVDLFTTDPNDGSTPMKIPAGVAPLAWLNARFTAEHLAQFEAEGSGFREVPQGVLPSANFIGDVTTDTMDGVFYENMDGTDGNGDPLPED